MDRFKISGKGAATIAIAAIMFISGGIVLHEYHRNDFKRETKEMVEVDCTNYDDVFNAMVENVEFGIEKDTKMFLQQEDISRALILSDKIQNNAEVSKNGEELVSTANDIENILLDEVKMEIAELTDKDPSKMEIHYHFDREDASPTVFIEYTDGIDREVINVDHNLGYVVQSIVKMQNLRGDVDYYSCIDTEDEYKLLAKRVDAAICAVANMKNRSFEVKTKHNKEYIKTL